jgi:hypothetical protein
MATKLALTAGAVLLLTASFAQENGERAPPRQVDIPAGGEPPAEEACFNVREARSFGAIDDGHIYLRARRDEHYLLTLFPGCFGLGSSVRIAVSNNISRVCSTDSAEVTYGGLGRTETCTIRRVEAVESREAAEALVEFRKRRN